MRRLAGMAALCSLLLAGAAVAPSGAAASDLIVNRFLTLRTSDYTNGPIKSRSSTGSFSLCGSTWDISATIKYDLLNASKIHIVSVTYKYYIAPRSDLVMGWYGRFEAPGRGSVDASDDEWVKYKFKASTVQSDGYSLAGTHTKALNVTFDNDGFVLYKDSTNGSLLIDCTGYLGVWFDWA